MLGFGKKQKGRVFVGLSGGVDSAVSAALLVRQGYDVTGVFIRIALPGYPCSAGADKQDAMRVAAALRIPFMEIDLSEEYRRKVFAPALDGFSAGVTPNPDTLCNREIKFGAFYDFARSHGADFVATGHYARTHGGALYAGADQNKDQSYFLWMVPKEVLEHTLFPVGEMQKPEVRRLAKKFKLPNAERKDSQGLCFLGDISMNDMLVRELKPAEGDVLSEDGKVIGRHDGAVLYTLGERRGFRLFADTVHTSPQYVIAKDAVKNTIIVSTGRYPTHAEKTRVVLRESNWTASPPAVCTARFRYRQDLIPAEISIQKNTAVLHEPQYVPAGQSLVFYAEGEEGILQCLGGGIVDKSELA